MVIIRGDRTLNQMEFNLLNDKSRSLVIHCEAICGDSRLFPLPTV
ncbi:hypothetical protein [Cyanobacterium stanieri]|nr:hypothetical protein [Cyanobacterium stanieri]